MLFIIIPFVRSSVGYGKNFVLAEESAKTDVGSWYPKPGNRQHAYEERPTGYGHLSPQPAHLAHVLLVVTTLDHLPRTEEEHGFEERMEDKVKQRRNPSSATEAEDHVTKLGERRIGKAFLDVHLNHRNQCHECQRQAAYRRDEHQRFWRHESIDPRNQIHTSCHHRRGVNQRTDRRRTSHGVGKPNM